MREAKYIKPLTTAFSEESYCRLKKISDEHRVSMADVVRSIIDQALTDEEKPVDINDGKEDEVLWKFVQKNEN